MIYDIFQFNNEFDILDIRLNSLDSMVDKFIITEAEYTYSGNKKELLLSEYINTNYSNFKDKIDIIIAKVPYTYLTFDKIHRKKNEYVQRNYFCNFYKFKSDDYLIIGDIDEIPHPNAVSFVVNSNPVEDVRLRQKFYYFFMNFRCRNDWVTGTVITRGVNFKSFSDTRLRQSDLMIHDGGWHYSYFDDPITKISNLVESEFDLDVFKNNEWINKIQKEKKDIFNRDIEWYIEEEFEILPYIYNNMERFSKYIYQEVSE